MPGFSEWCTQQVYEKQLSKQVIKADSGDVGSALNFAKSAVVHVRNVLPIGECNRASNRDRTGQLSSQAVGNMRQEINTFSPYVQNQLLSERIALNKGTNWGQLGNTIFWGLSSAAAERHCAGNCGEQASVALAYLLGLKGFIFRVEKFRMLGGDHGFLVLNRPDSSNAAEWKSWGSAAVVCDPWYNRAFLAQNFNKELLLRKGKPDVEMTLEPNTREAALFLWARSCYSELVQQQDDKAKSNLDVRVNKMQMQDQLQSGLWVPLQDSSIKVLTRFYEDVAAKLDKVCEDSNLSEEALGFVAILTEMLVQVTASVSKASVKTALEAMRTHVREGIGTFKSVGGLGPVLSLLDGVEITKLDRTLDLGISV